MKKAIYIFTFLSILTIAACKQDKCSGVACINGGTCQDGKCTCNSAFTGERCEIHTNACDTLPCHHGNCSTGTCNCYPHFFGDSCTQQETPSHIFITGFTVNHFNPASQAGVLWDADRDGSPADIYPVIKKNGVEIYNGNDGTHTLQYNFVADANYDTQHQFVFHEDSIDISGADVTGATFRVELWDYDDGINPDDLMEGRDFVLYSGIDGFPGSITVNDTTTYHDKFEFRINLSGWYKW